MLISEDGTVTGSVNVARLDEVKPKTDEAKAQLEGLKPDTEQAERDAQRASQGERALGINSTGRDEDEGSERDRAKARESQQQDAQRQEAEHQERERLQRQDEANQPTSDQEVAQLRTQAEQAGVAVDNRWGADRLRQEIAAKQSAKKG